MSFICYHCQLPSKPGIRSRTIIIIQKNPKYADRVPDSKVIRIRAKFKIKGERRDIAKEVRICPECDKTVTKFNPFLTRKNWS